MPYKDKNKQREFNRVWIASRRLEFFSTKKCTKCGSVSNLELDHIKREGKLSHNIWSWSKEKREEEIEKCQVLCHDCHKEKTKEEWEKLCKHGTLTMYKDYRCRCIECKKIWNEATKKWKNGLSYK